MSANGGKAQLMSWKGRWNGDAQLDCSPSDTVGTCALIIASVNLFFALLRIAQQLW
jgi:hypothetical protein